MALFTPLQGILLAIVLGTARCQFSNIEQTGKYIPELITYINKNFETHEYDAVCPNTIVITVISAFGVTLCQQRSMSSQYLVYMAFYNEGLQYGKHHQSVKLTFLSNGKVLIKQIPF